MNKKLDDNPLYRFLCDQISSIVWEIHRNKGAIKTLAAKQESLKRGKTKLVKLRRELVKQIGLKS